MDRLRPRSSGADRHRHPPGDEVECANRTRDVLDVLFAKVLRLDHQLAPDLVVYGAGDADPPWRRKALQSGCNIHPIAEQVGSRGHHIAEVDADPQHDAIGFLRHAVACPHRFLNFEGATHGFDWALKFCQQGIARRIEDPAIMLADEAGHCREALAHEPDGALLILRDEKAVADDVAGKDGREPSCRLHGSLPGRP